MKKKVSLKDVSSDRWKIKKGDRSSVSSARSAASTSGAVDRMVEIAEINTNFLKKMGEAVDTFLANTPAAAPTPVEYKPNIEVTIPDRNTKRKFRVTPVRQDGREDGFILYCDIEEI